jgi:hypothetical protein
VSVAAGGKLKMSTSAVDKRKRKTHESAGTGEIIRIPTQNHSDAADSVLQFFAVLAYPHISEKAKRDPFAAALHAGNYKARIWDQRKNKYDSASVRMLIPSTARQRIRGIQGQTNKGFKRITRRIHAGNIAASFYFNDTRGRYESPSSSGSSGVVIVGPNSAREALHDLVRAKEKLGTHRELDDAAENERKHTWLASMQVLHLCIVLFLIINGFPKGTPSEAMYFDLVQHPEWLHDALLRAEGFRMVLHECIPEFDRENAIRLLPSESLPLTID